ncbi:chitin deacetylase 1-like [Tachypleus tridentatus]|uniref:chitin deacetylase 1-like n=1 Tax=Tachypleus tridentatus TaxID=6853 RepID=UPI003FD456C7
MVSRTARFLVLVALLTNVLGVSIVKRQADSTNSDTKNDSDLCKGRSPSEYFRLTAAEDCRDVVRCSVQGLLALRCPTGLAFDIEKQTCGWKDQVKNCDQVEKPRLATPLLSTDEPICSENQLACGNGECIERKLFCDGEPQCTDGSDENACTKEKDPNRAPPCDQKQCILPDCFCSHDGTLIPGGKDPNEIPQMVMITFDDAVNINNIDIYEELFSNGRNNPNGCSIKGTFFVSHKYTNYSAVQELHRKGHEIASHSITHRDDETYWSSANLETWAKEMAGMRLILEKFANITDNSIVGVRSPYLRLGGNTQFRMLEEQSFLYDSSITVPLSNPPLWPYTLYFSMPHKCHGNGQNCPTRSHAVWEMIMNELDRREDPSFDENLAGCAMVDSCSNLITGEQFYNFLNHNLERHYNTNRAPLGLFFHAGFLKLNPEFLDALISWIDEMLDRTDIYFVTMTQVLQWMQNPTELSRIREFPPWKEKCEVKGQPYCSIPNACPLTTRELPGETIRLHTCMDCSQNYPWIEDPTGDYFSFKK